MKTIFAISLIVLLVGCTDSKEYPKTPPPEFKILHSVGNKFIAEMKYGTKLYTYEICNLWGCSGNDRIPFDTYQDAVNRAWRQYEYSHPPSDGIDWKEYKPQDNSLNKERL